MPKADVPDMPFPIAHLFRERLQDLELGMNGAHPDSHATIDREAAFIHAQVQRQQALEWVARAALAWDAACAAEDRTAFPSLEHTKAMNDLAGHKTALRVAVQILRARSTSGPGSDASPLLGTATRTGGEQP